MEYAKVKPPQVVLRKHGVPRVVKLSLLRIARKARGPERPITVTWGFCFPVFPLPL